MREARRIGGVEGGPNVHLCVCGNKCPGGRTGSEEVCDANEDAEGEDDGGEETEHILQAGERVVHDYPLGAALETQLNVRKQEKEKKRRGIEMKIRHFFSQA